MSDEAPIGGRYRRIRRLGRGATGEVFEATDGHRSVAVKLLFPHYAENELNRTRFFREMDVLRSLRHPQVVRLLDSGWDDGAETLFLVMELLRGRTLADLFKERPSPSRGELWSIVRQAVEGVAAAHERGIIHRDIKPENVLVEEDQVPPRACVIDFGLAKHIDGASVTQTEIGLGTPLYMAPEQATTARQVTPAADVWSLGVLLYRVAAGNLPFPGDSPYDVLLKSTLHRLPASGAPEPIGALLRDCLEKDPSQRPADAGVLHRRLLQVSQRGELGPWFSEPCRPPASTPVELSATQPHAEDPPWSVSANSAGSRPTPWLGYGMAAMSLVAAWFLGMWLGRAPEPPSLELPPPPGVGSPSFRAERLSLPQLAGSRPPPTRRVRPGPTADPSPPDVVPAAPGRPIDVPAQPDDADGEVSAAASSPAPPDQEDPAPPSETPSESKSESLDEDEPVRVEDPGTPPAPEPNPDAPRPKNKPKPEELLTF